MRASAGLLVVADGKRGDVPVSATAYGEALFGRLKTASGELPGLAADAATVNPLLGGDALEPLIVAAARAGAGLFALVRTSNPGAADVLDLPADGGPLHEHLARMVAERGPRLRGESGLERDGRRRRRDRAPPPRPPARADARRDLPRPGDRRPGRPCR